MKRTDGASVLGRRNEPVNLRERFGDRYRIVRDEAYEAELPEFRRSDEVWLQQIPCKYGHIYPHSGTTLGAWSDRPSRRRLLSELACCAVHLEGDHEISVLFDVSDFESVARVLQPRRRRRLTEAQRQDCKQRLSACRSATKRPTPELN